MTRNLVLIFRVIGIALLTIFATAIYVAPPAITLYQNNGFFWWGFVPGLVAGAGIMALIIPPIFLR